MGITQTISWKAFLCQFQKVWEAPSQTLIIIGALFYDCLIIDYAIIHKYGGELHTSALQFAYKQHHSTIMCTSIFQEVMNYYNRNGSNVYACFVDASKVFDRINYSNLFQTAIMRNLPGTIIRLLFDSYTRQKSFVKFVKWGQEFSNVI